MASILVKAYVRQLFGSPDIHLFEFDSQTASIANLREAVSGFVNGRTVTLTWLDQDGDEIRLSTDEQLTFAVKHGLRDNVLRVNVRVDWLGLESGHQHRRRHPQVETTEPDEAKPAVDQVIDGEESAGVGAEASVQAQDGDGEGTNMEEEAGALTEDAGAAEGTGTINQPNARAKKNKNVKRHGDRAAQQACYAGFVRTVGADGVAKERDLTEEEAAYLLHHSSPLGNLTACSPFSLGSFFSAPRLQYHDQSHRRSVNAPLLLTW